MKTASNAIKSDDHCGRCREEPSSESINSTLASDTFTVRVKLPQERGLLGTITNLINQAGGEIEGLHPVPGAAEGFSVKDITIACDSRKTAQELIRQLQAFARAEIVNLSDSVFLAHLGGKIRVVSKMPITNAQVLGDVYTPGVAAVCEAIRQDPAKAYALTIKRNSVAVVTDGSRILALGNIGPLAGLPVMEGKAAIFKEFADIDAFPICLNTQDTEEIIRTVKAIAPVFGGINLEDIASPRCYEVEARLREELDIPVFHDDKHGTAVVVTAATLNAVKLVNKRLRNIKVICNGVGAAGMACAKMLLDAGVKNLIGFNRGGAIFRGRPGMGPEESWLAEHSNPHNFQGTMKEGLAGADMFLGLSAGDILRGEDLKVMRRDPIVFALANPRPEVDPKEAAPYVRVFATGSSKHPNQINNALVFPGMFRGALDCRINNITEEMKMEAARALAALVPRGELEEHYVIPSVFDPRVVPAVSGAVHKVAMATGQARRCLKQPSSHC